MRQYEKPYGVKVIALIDSALVFIPRTLCFMTCMDHDTLRSLLAVHLSCYLHLDIDLDHSSPMRILVVTSMYSTLRGLNLTI